VFAYGAEGFAALGDPTRRAIFARIAERPRAVGELAGELPVSRPAVSQHLKVLKAAGLVVDRAEGNRRIYQADPAGLAALRAQLDTFWSQALATYEAVVEHDNEEERMTTPTEVTSVRNEVVVNAPVQRAFAVFTEQMDRIKPREHNMLGVDIEETVFEPRVGGRIYDRGTDGSECEWATVLAYEPPERVVFSWNISPHWHVEPDPSKRSEVEVRFIAEDQQRTRVELEHRHLDHHGDGWEGARDGVAAPDGWGLDLGRYADLV
jgi:DNA-binding transcriptional ArsR family regulator/uncharacterized protein YndB with AHSA1/START domain